MMLLVMLQTTWKTLFGGKVMSLMMPIPMHWVAAEGSAVNQQSASIVSVPADWGYNAAGCWVTRQVGSWAGSRELA